MCELISWRPRFEQIISKNIYTSPDQMMKMSATNNTNNNIAVRHIEVVVCPITLSTCITDVIYKDPISVAIKQSIS